MANRYRYNVKKTYGKLSKMSDTFFADNIQEACVKFVDILDYRVNDNNYSYVTTESKYQTSGKSEDYVLFKLDYAGEQIQAFIEKVN